MQIRIAKPADFWSGILFAGVGIAAYVLAMDYEPGTARRMGPGFLPIALSVILLVLGAIIVLKSLALMTGPEEAPRTAAVSDAADRRFEIWSTVRAATAVTVSLVFFGAALPSLGLVLSITGLVIISSFADPRLTWVTTLIIAAFMSALSVAVFRYGIGLSLQVWP
ncbi:tripartite tricarboxylate transporter TctB family protein [Alkalilacustris brevis]|uniref:tripartite tricarboxylate transporter TctB family protein n=1 Tax=Alkalilacustris brevis TaxID=2026338 RepID=UPI001390597E|nr:tripartite tricarboxylate transporter TctB family protein [Alkalilacustris brevis]